MLVHTVCAYSVPPGITSMRKLISLTRRMPSTDCSVGVVTESCKTHMSYVADALMFDDVYSSTYFPLVCPVSPWYTAGSKIPFQGQKNIFLSKSLENH